MAGTISRGNAPRLLQEGVKKVFGQAYNNHKTEWIDFLEQDTSNKAFEIDVQFEGFGLAVAKDDGADVAFDSQRQGFSPKYPHIEYAKGFVATKQAIRDNLYGQFSKRAKALAFSMTQTKEVVAANVLNNGGTSTVLMDGGDGVSLFNDLHPQGPTNGGTFSNRLAVTADLSEASIEDLLIQIGEAVDPAGLKIALRAKKVIVPVKQMFNAQRIFGSVLQNDTNNNATNAMKDMSIVEGGFSVNHYLTSPTAFFITTNAPDGLKYYNRQSVEFGEDNAFSSGNMRFKADERYSVGWSDALGCFGSIDVV